MVQLSSILKKGILAFTLFIIGLEIFSQDVWYNVVSIPPSPNASSLGKFGEYPVDKSTGVPSIILPIYEINYGGIKVPISLSYHASGTKINEEESWVGMGWSLNAGGAITRVMKGRPDELRYGFLDHDGYVPEEEDFNSRYHLDGCSLKDSLELMSSNQWDFEPDIFYYNFANLSGSFWINNVDSTVKLRPGGKENFKFIAFSNSYGGAFSFKVTDTEGNIYIFEDPEQSTIDIKGSIPEFISAWFLTL
jgi:hypothetical protein